MKHTKQHKGHNTIPSLCKDIICKMDVSNLNGTAGKYENGPGKPMSFNTLPTGITCASSY
jgi:hypothetical protein